MAKPCTCGHGKSFHHSGSCYHKDKNCRRCSFTTCPCVGYEAAERKGGVKGDDVIDEREIDVVHDAAGAAICASYLDRLIAALLVKCGGPVSAFTVVSHPKQANGLRSQLAYMDEEWRNNSYVLETNVEKRVKAWLEVPDFDEDKVLIESPKGRALLKNLTTVGL